MKSTTVGPDLSVPCWSRWARRLFSSLALVVASIACAQTYSISTLAGDGTIGVLANPESIAVDVFGNVYATDTFSGIRKIGPGGTVSTFGPSGVLSNIRKAIAVDNGANLFVADTNNHVIRRIDASGTTITVIAGVSGSPGASVVGPVNATDARFNTPTGIAVNSTGTIIYVADTGNQVIRKIDLTVNPAQVTTIAGTQGAGGNSPTLFSSPHGLALSPNNVSPTSLIVADRNNHIIRSVAISSNNAVTTIAGTGFPGSSDTPGTFNQPTSVAVDSSGNILVGDYGNHLVRRITGSTVTTVAGTVSTPGFLDAVGTQARFNGPWGVAIDSAGNLYVGDTNNQRVRKGTAVATQAPVINLQPVSATYTLGVTSAVSFSVSATGNPPVSYQWQRAPASNPTFFSNLINGTSNGLTVNGATSSLLTITGPSLFNNGDVFQVIVTNGVSPNATSTSAILTVQNAPAPTINQHPQPQVLVAGQTSATFNVIAVGDPAISSYQWERSIGGGGFSPITNGVSNGATFTGATTATLSISGITAALNGDAFRVVVSNGTPVTSNSATLQVPPVFISPTSTTFATGQGGFFQIQAQGNPAPTITLTSGSPAAGYTFTPGTGTATISGSSNDSSTVILGIQAQNSGGTTTQLVTVSVQPPTAPTIISSSSTSFTVGQFGVFHFQAFGSPTPNFTLSGPGIPAGMTFVSPTLSGIPLSAEGSPLTYTVTATNGSGTSATQTFTLTLVGVPPVITTNPTGVTANVGGTAVFTAGASGTPPPQLRWQRQPNGTTGFVDITDSSTFTGTTTGTLTLVSVDAFMAGDQFRLSASNGSGGVIYSLPAQLTVNVGTPFTTFAGSPNISGGVDGTGTSARFSNPNAVATDSSGNVYVADTGNHTIRRITSAGVVSVYAGFPGASGSNDGTGSGARFNSPQGVAVDSAGNVYVADTSNHTIRIIAPSGAVTTLAGAPGLGGGQDGVGTGARFLLPSAVVVDLTGSVYVADTGNHAIRQVLSNGTTTTYAGSLGIAGTNDGVGTGARFNAPSGITRDLNNNLYVADTSNHTIRRITSGAVVTTVAGAAGQPGIADGNAATARFNRPTGLATDNVLNVYIADKFSNTIRRMNSAGDTITIAGQAGVPGSNDGTGTQARFSQPSGVALDNNGNIYVADTLNHTIRKSGALTAPTFTTHPANRVAPIGGTVTFTVAASGSPTPGYQWQRLSPTATFNIWTNISNDATFSGTNTATLTITNVTTSMTGDQYRAVASNGVSPAAFSNAATLTVGVAPTFTSPATASFQALQAGTFTVTVNSDPAATFSATGLPSWATLNSTTGVISGTPPDTSGSPFAVTITANNGVSATQNLTLTVTAAPPTIATQPASSTVDQGATASFTVTATGTPPFSYQWRRNGSPIGGATAATYSISNVQPSAAATYTVVVTNAVGSATSNGATLTVNSVPVISLQPGPQVAITGTSATFNVAASGGNLSYQWRRNGAPIGGANGTSYTLNNVAAGDAGNFDVVVSNGFGTVNSSLAQLTVVTGATAPVITSQPAARSVVAGGTVTFMVGASGAPTPAYQWRKNGGAIAGANGASYTLTGVQAADGANYDVVVSNTAGSVTSQPAGLTVLSRSFAGYYFGSFTNNLGDFAIYIRDDNTGVFLGYLPASTVPVMSLNIRVNDSGVFSFTQPAIGSVGQIGIGGTINANGTLSGSMLGGAIGTFAGDRAPDAGATQGVAGYYQAGSGTTGAAAYVIAGPNSVAFAVVQAGAVSDGGRGTVNAGGSVAVSSSRSLINFSLSTGGILSGTATGPVAGTYSGGSEAQLLRQRLVNISSRARVGSGDAVAIAGFVIAGGDSKPVLIRAVGPTLGAAPFNVPGALASPRVELVRDGVSLAVNSGIGTNRAAIDAAGVAAAAFPLGTAGTDAAILTTLAPGNYTAVVSSSTNTAGVALVEVYDLSAPVPGQKLLNIATRASAGTNENLLIAGFVVPPGSAKRVLIRGVGPGLTPFGVTGVLAQPTLQLLSGTTVVAQNTNWSTSVDAAAITSGSLQVGAFGLANNDSALVVTLAPGNYTAQVSGANNTTGVALIEVYELP